MEQEKSDDRVNMLLGKKENPALNKMLGKKISEENLLGKNDRESALNRMLGKEHTKSKYEKELTDDAKIKCPKCGHEFEVE